MSTFALLLASGKGQRTRQDIPKQFINVYDKPIIIYTLENFQRHPDIDGIVVVCLDGWQDILRAYSRQYNITKLKGIVEGGATVQESSRNGVFAIKEQYDDDDVVVIHDGIRPMVDEDLRSSTTPAPKNISSAKLCAASKPRKPTSSENFTGRTRRRSRRKLEFTVRLTSTR